MDSTKKTLAIDIDTSALNQNLASAKTAVSALTDQLNALKAAGQANGPVFTQLSAQFKSAVDLVNQNTTALKAYTDALTKKTQAEQADTKAAQDSSTALQAQQKQAAGGTADNAAGKSPQTPQSSPPSNTVTPTAASATDKKAPAIVDPVQNKKLITTIENDIQEFYKKDIQVAQKHADDETKILKTRDTAYLSSTDTILGLVGKNTEASKIALGAKKAFTAAEIAINTEQQISSYISATAEAVNQDMRVPFVGEALAAIDIAMGVVEVASAIANGASQLSKLGSISIPSAPSVPGKARGGIFQSDGMGAYLTGPGTGTSDSINARLSNGESVINARSTAMFAPILSAINMVGGGRTFESVGSGGTYALGGLFNGSNTLNDGSSDLANTRAMNDMAKTLAANIPRQVLVVEDVQASLQNKVMLQNMSNF